MRRVETRLPRILLLSASLLMIVSVLAESAAGAPAPSGDPCVATTFLHCVSYGSGDPIIALHGLGGTLYSWRNLVNKFPNHQLILFDLKGAGDSPKPHDKHYSIEDQANLILQFIRQNDLKNLTLMGNSYGGAVSLFLAIELSKELPSRLASLILIDSGGYDEDLPTHLKLLRTPLIGWLGLHLLLRFSIKRVLHDSYYDKNKITDEQVDAYVNPLKAPGARYALLQTAKQAIPKNIDQITAQYKNLSVPTLIIWGLDDRIIPLKIGGRLHLDLSHSTLELIDRCGHVPQEEMPAETMIHITQFFRGLGWIP
ncbi:MAG: alpha/beta hydrolase [Acidobacteria bacterium]|nr:MAG: alpha/beta hydrolase [Acidobacteriota bacterium]